MSMLKIDDIHVYYGAIHAIKGVSFEVNEGEIVALIGANGAGKSTTLNTVAGLLRSRTGSVRFMDEELRHVPSHKLVGWCLIAIGALIAYEQIIMNTLGDILWRWGQKAPVWRAIYLVMDQLPEVVLCVALILCGIWLVRGPRAKKTAPETAAPEETDFQEYQPEKKMPSLLDRFARKAEPDTTGEVTLDPEDEDDGREEE